MKSCTDFSVAALANTPKDLTLDETTLGRVKLADCETNPFLKKADFEDPIEDLVEKNEDIQKGGVFLVCVVKVEQKGIEEEEAIFVETGLAEALCCVCVRVLLSCCCV